MTERVDPDSPLVLARRANVAGRLAIAFAVVSVVLGVALQVLPVFELQIAVTTNDLVAYPTSEAMYAAHYAPVVTIFWTAGIIHLLPSITAVVFGMIGVRRPQPVGAAVAWGIGVLSVISAIVGFALIPTIADAVGTASISG